MTLIPDVELVLSQYLRSRGDVYPDLVERIGTVTPKSTLAPWLRITQIGDTQRSNGLWFLAALVQIDCYASDTGGQAEASLIARTVRHALDEMPKALLEDAVVTSVSSSMRRSQDDAFDPARERYILQVSISLHPVPVAA